MSSHVTVGDDIDGNSLPDRQRHRRTSTEVCYINHIMPLPRQFYITGRENTLVVVNDHM